MANYKGLAIGAYGGVAETSLTMSASAKIRFSAPPTTPPTTGLNQWELFVVAANGGTGAQLALCTTGNTLVYSTFDTSTFGRTT